MALGLARSMLAAPLAALSLHPPALVDEAQTRGIDFTHAMQSFPPAVQQVLDHLPPVGAAAAAGDVNGDGHDDLFLTSSARGTECALYVATPGGRFRDRTAAAGLLGLNDARGLATGAALADVDTDGDLDLYVVRWGPDILFLNRGDGTFMRAAGAAADPGNGSAAVFFDADSDGDPDLYVANLLPDVPILEVDRLDPPAAGLAGASNGGTNRLYRNDGGRFVDVTERSGAGDSGWSITAAAGDVDADGDPDLLVGNAYGPLCLYRNQGGFEFTPDQDCFHGSSMSLGIDLGDVNGDLRDDILVTGLGHPRGAVERSCLWLARAGGKLEEAGDAAGLGSVFRGAGARFADLDRDGDLDLLFANGFDGRSGKFEELAARWVRLDSLGSANPLARFRPAGAEAAGRWCVAWNAAGNFTLDREGGALPGPGCAASLLDVGDDGLLDAYVACQGGAGVLLVNHSENPNRWIAFELLGRKEGPAALGARVTVRGHGTDADGRGLHVARGLDWSGGSRGETARGLYFGVGQRDLVDAQVVWPNGAAEIHTSLSPGQVMRLIEPEAGSGSAPGARPRWTPADSLEHPAFRLESVLRRRPTDFELAADYRALCLERQLYPRALRFFRELRGPFPVTLALHRMLVHADGVHRLEEGLLVRGASAAMALIEAGELIRSYPEFWTAYRLRALNYLYWPIEFGHLSRCVADYRRCVQIRDRARQREPHHAQVLLELGDAYAKGGQVGEAVATWRRGQKLDPGETEFARRLAIPRDRVATVVSELRSLDHPPATRIPWLDAEMSREPLRAELALAAAGARAWNATGPGCGDPQIAGAADVRADSEAAAFLARAAQEPNNLVAHMLGYGSALARVEDLVIQARGVDRPDTEAVLLARGWLLLKGALTPEQIEAAHQALAAGARRLAGRAEEHPRYERCALLARLGMGDAENLLGRLESGYEAWRAGKDRFDEPAVARRVLIPLELVEQEVWSWSFGHGVVEIDELTELLR